MSDIWLRKIKTYFHVFDLEKKRVVTLEDFELMPKLFAERENASPELRDKGIKAFHDVRYLKRMKYSLTSEKKFYLNKIDETQLAGTHAFLDVRLCEMLFMLSM